MENKSLLKIAKEIYFKGLGHIDWNEVAIKYKLSNMELNYVVSLIRNWNKR